MYSLERITRGLRNPPLIARELNRLVHRRGNRWEYNKEGINIFDEDWDNCIILDACRYDMLKRSNLPGVLESRISRASATTEFLRANFLGRDLRDTVYVTANPQLDRHDEIEAGFHAIIDVWRDGWDDEYRTVRPEVMADATISAAEEHPNKRILSHFIQPHYPFIGPTGRKHFDLDSLDFWSMAIEGKLAVSDDVLRQAFEETLELAIPSVERLIETLPGMTVVTADHGQVIGERSFPIPVREYGHPRGTYIDELVRVPWNVTTNGERKRIVAEEPEERTEDIDSDVVTDRLKQLGYV